jgi:hypothetical protein
MHVATVGRAIANANTTSLAVTVTRQVPAGHTLLMGIVWEAAAGSVPTISSIVDTRSNTWTTTRDDSTFSGTTVACAIVRARVTTTLLPGDTVTVTVSVARSRWAAQIDDFDDLAASPLDAHTHNSGTATSLSTGTTGATVAQAELVFAVFGFPSARGPSIPAGWGGGTDLETTAGTTDRAVQTTWLYVSSTGTQTGTLTLASSSAYAAAIATYKVNIPRPHVPEVPRFVAGTDPDAIADMLNTNIRDALTFLTAPPTFRARRTGSLTVAENTHQDVAWDQIDEDSYGGWGPSQTPAQSATRYVVQEPGMYAISAVVSLSGTGATSLVLIPAAAKNGVSASGQGPNGWEGQEVFVPTGASTQPKLSSGYWEIYALPGDYFEVDLWFSTESAIVAVDTTGRLPMRGRDRLGRDLTKTVRRVIVCGEVRHG